MKHARITFADGQIIDTSINGTDQEIKDYYKIGRYFNLGMVNDNMQKVIKCEIIKDQKQ